MKQHILKKMMPGVGVFVAFVMMTTGFAGSALAQTSGDISTSTATTTNSTATSTDTTTATTTNTTTATSTGQATTTPVHIVIMNHLCNANIKNMNDFMSIQQGLSPVAALGATVLNCPATGLPNNAPTPGTVAAARSAFDFSVMGPDNMKAYIASSTFTNHKLCESDLNVDVNMDGSIASTTCLDTSHYHYPETSVTSSSSQITVMETIVPNGYHFGALKFTPTELDGNNDAASLVSVMPNDNTGQGTIVLNTATDTDRTIMLHVYNFIDTGNGTTTATSTGNGGGTSTTTNNGGNNNNGGSNNNGGGNMNGGGFGTTTATTTSDFFNFQIARLSVIQNILQRVEDIQSRIVDIVASLASGNWGFNNQ